jgi:ATP-dependent DNA ligase
MKLLARLASTASRLEKEAILKASTSPMEWRVFITAYNPYWMYHQRFKSHEIDDDNLGEPCQMLFNLLERLQARELTGHAARDAVEAHAKVFGDLIKLVCNKDLRCGVTATLFNNAHPKSIPQFKVQLAKEVPLDKLKYPVLGQVKYDGVRLIVINSSGAVTFRTRNGKTVVLPKLQATLEAKPHVNYILDSEIVLADGVMEDRTAVSGIVNSAMHGGHVCESDLVLHCFDFMCLNDWENLSCPEPYRQRLDNLYATLCQMRLDNVLPAPTVALYSPKEVSEYYEVLLSEGYEGAVLKHGDHLYTFKRSKDWAKLKETKTADLLCVSIQGGTGKYEGKIGALVLRGEVEGKQVKVSVGSGLTDVDRGHYQRRYLNQIIEVKYNCTIRDSVTNNYSLFLPRFVCVRIDK